MSKRRYQQPNPKPRRNRSGSMVWDIQYRDLNGTARTKTLGRLDEMNHSQACWARDEFLRPINQHIIRPAGGRPKESLAEFTEGQFFPAKAATKWREGTAETNISRIRKHVLGPIGHVDIRDVTQRMLQHVLNDMAPGLSESTVNSVRFILGDLFEYAMGDGAVDRNPTARLYTPRGCKPAQEKPVVESLSTIDRILAVLDVREVAIFRLAIVEGMRIGEVLGLRIADVALDASEIRIRQALARTVIGETKNKKGKRDAGLSSETAAALVQWIETLSDRRPDAWLFPSDRIDGPIRRDAILKRIKEKLSAIGLDWVNFKVARRSSATMMKAMGVDAHTRAAQLGHTVSVQETEYAIASKDAKLAAVRNFDKRAVQ